MHVFMSHGGHGEHNRVEEKIIRAMLSIIYGILGEKPIKISQELIIFRNFSKSYV